MRVLIATGVMVTFAAAAAAALALHTPPSKAFQPVKTGTAAAPADAVPGLVWRSGSAMLRLTDRPCPSAELAAPLEIEGVSGARAYEVQQGSKRYVGCWAKDVAGDVLTMEPGREIGSIPIGWFRTGG